MFVNERVRHPVAACHLIALVAALVSGCTPDYQAPNLPASKLAVIVAGTDELAVLSVDGQRTSVLPETGCPQVAVLPGEHVIGVRHKRNGAFAEGTLTVDFKAGRRYVLKSAFRGYGVTFWMEEEPRETPSLI
jgi:hypothetical protein